MRLAVLFALAATPALAEIAPGGPPWSCTVAMACEDGHCIPLPGELARLRLSQTADPAVMQLETAGAAPQRILMAEPGQYDGPVKLDGFPPGISLIALPDEGIADAVGFFLHTLATREGVTRLSPNSAALVCFGETP